MANKDKTVDLIGWKTINVTDNSGNIINGLSAIWDAKGKRWLIPTENVTEVLDRNQRAADKAKAKQTKKAAREQLKKEREEKKRQKEEEYKKSAEYQDKLRKQKEKEDEKNAKKQEKQDAKDLKEQRTWNHWYCDKHHSHVKAAVNQYYTMFKNVINDDAWNEGRGKEIQEQNGVEVKLEKANEAELIPSGPLVLVPKYKSYDVEIKPYENDYKAEYKKNSRGFDEIVSDNWDNCWHRDRWEYILLHKNGPGKKNGSKGEALSENEAKEDPIFKKGVVDNLDLDTQIAIREVKKDFNDDFLMGNETNDVFKSDVEIQNERDYNASMTTASQQWQNSNQTKQQDTSTPDVYLYNSYTGEIIKSTEFKGLVVKNIYNDSNSVQDNLKGAAVGINSSLNMINEIITPKLVTYVTTYMTNVVATYTQRAVVQMLSFDAQEIVSMATKLMPNYIKTPAAIMKELLSTTEDISKIEIELKQNEMMSKFNNILGKKAAMISDAALKGLEKCNNEIAAVSYYTQMGPAWVNDKIEKVINESLKFTLGYIGKARDFVDKEKNKLVYNLSNEMSKQLALKANKALETTTKEKLDQIENKKQMALNKAKTMITKAKLMLFALIGG